MFAKFGKVFKLTIKIFDPGDSGAVSQLQWDETEKLLTNSVSRQSDRQTCKQITKNNFNTILDNDKGKVLVINKLTGRHR